MRLQSFLSSYIVKEYILFIGIFFSFGFGRKIADDGELRGSTNTQSPIPVTLEGMALIPTGEFMMGGGVNQSVIQKTNLIKKKTVTRFYIDVAPVTNGQYRNFLARVRKDPAAYGLDSDYIEKHLVPDPMIWQRDFSEIFTSDTPIKNYFDNTLFEHHPVVGITWEAAKQYARVRSIIKNNALKAKGINQEVTYRLPTAAEYEYAAKGGSPTAQYPWDGPYVFSNQGADKKENALANFRLSKGSYVASGSSYTSPIKSFPPNRYGLYDMAGNVSEWCEDDYHPLLTDKVGDINPCYRADEGGWKVIKGGSWKDFSYFLQTGVMDCEHKDVARCYIGFRCVMSSI